MSLTPFPSQEAIVERVKLRTQKADDKDLSDMAWLEGDEQQVKTRNSIENLTSNKLLTRLPILLAQIKAGSNS